MMTIIFSIIGVFAVVMFFVRLTAILLIRYINSKSEDKMNPIYHLKTIRGFNRNLENNWYIIPNIHFNFYTTQTVVTINFLIFEYYIEYSYSHADDQ